MGKRGWIIFGVITVALLGGLIALSSQNRLDISEFNASTVIGATEKNGNIADHTTGSKANKLILIEYGDYQCPGCGSAYERVNQLTEKYKDQVTFVFRNFPLTSIHQHARAAAATAEAAGLQGKYWQMHDKLYANQQTWSATGISASDRSKLLRDYASELGLDMNRYDKDIVSAAVDQKIRFDQAIFKSTGFKQETPTFTLNGKKIESDVWGKDDTFDNFIREEIKKAGLELPADQK